MEYDILEYAAVHQCQELHMAIDKASGLKAIVAIHNRKLGPALGGCRLIEYPSTNMAAIDAIRLAEGMTYKAALAKLPLGGGKMVVLKPAIIENRESLFRAIGRFVNSLGGRYITAEDSGTSPEDMDIVRQETPFVTGTSTGPLKIADPSILTARGVFRGIEATVKYQLGKNSLKDVHVTLLGLGHVGYNLAERLHQAEAKITAYEIDLDKLDKALKNFNINVASSLEDLIRTKADVFAPCALGAILNDDTIHALNAQIVAGAANNQLAESHHGKMLKERGILYAPDYVINAGGLIYVATEFSQVTEEESLQNIDNIYDTLIEIFKRSDKENRPTNEIADEMAREKLS